MSLGTGNSILLQCLARRLWDDLQTVVDDAVAVVVADADETAGDVRNYLMEQFPPMN